MTRQEQPTNTTPWFKVVTFRRYAAIEYDFWRCRVDLTQEAAQAIDVLFQHAAKETFRRTKRRKPILMGAGPVCGFVHAIDRALVDTLVAELKSLFSPAFLVPLDWKWNPKR